MKSISVKLAAIFFCLTLIITSVPIEFSVCGENKIWAPIITEDWADLNDWSVIESSPVIVPSSSYLHLSDNEYVGSEVSHNIFASTNIDTTETYSVEIRAKLNNFTYGPGAAGKDCNSLSLQIWPKIKTRFMFSVEDGAIKTSNASGTWSNTIALPESFDATEWHVYKIVVNPDSSVDVYGDDILLGSGAMQSLSWGNQGFKIFAKGHTDSGKQADAYVDYIKLLDNLNTVIFSDDFDTVDTSVWSAASSLASVYSEGNLLKLSSSDFSLNGVSNSVSLSNYNSLKISFDAKINSYSSGHGTGASDFTTLGFKLSFGDKRFMFAIENNHIDASTASSTWGFDADISDTSRMQNYTLYVDKTSGNVDISVNNIFIGTAALQSRAEAAGIQLFSRGLADENYTEAYVSDFSVSYEFPEGTAYWNADDEITVSNRTDNGFTISWPEATCNEECQYLVYLDSVLITTLSDTTYTFENLTAIDGGYNVTVKAKNSNGISTSFLSANASPISNSERDTMDIKNIIPNNTKYTLFRIPGIITTKEDSVIIYYEGRIGSGSDWANMDIIAMRSTDGGETFSQPIVLVDGTTTEKTINNPVMITGNDGTLHLLYCVEYGVCTECNNSADENCTHGCGVFYKSSKDDGISWSEAVNITYSTSPEIRNVIATGPGHGICLSNGTLVVPIWYVPKSAGEELTSHYNSLVSSIYSTDNGVTWQMGETLPCGATFSPNETAAVETSDGRVMFYVRIIGDKYRGLAYSETGYSEWTPINIENTLIDPTCFGSVVKYNQNDAPYTILSVNCEDQTDRKNLVVKGSSDDGKIWNMRKVITSGGAGYSDIAVDSKGTIYVLYEENWGASGKLARFSYDCFINKNNNTSDIKVWDGTVAEGDNLPTDSKGNGYLEISTPEQLAWFVKNGGKAELVCDIWINDMVVSTVNECAVINKTNGEAVSDISTLKEWFVSETDDPSTAFGSKIELKGNGHTVNGIFYSSPIKYGETGSPNKRYGLFPAPADQSVICELGIENSYMLTDSAYGAACIVGQAQVRSLTISDCYVANSVYHSGYQVAAILGGGAGNSANTTIIENCYSMAYLKATNLKPFALSGNTWNATRFTVKNCYVGNGAKAYQDGCVTAENVYFDLSDESIIGIDALNNLSGLPDDHWYAVESRTPMLRSRGAAIGDADSNGKFEFDKDLIELRKAIINGESLLNGDITRDGEIDIRDLVKLNNLQ